MLFLRKETVFADHLKILDYIAYFFFLVHMDWNYFSLDL